MSSFTLALVVFSRSRPMPDQELRKALSPRHLEPEVPSR